MLFDPPVFAPGRRGACAARSAGGWSRRAQWVGRSDRAGHPPRRARRLPWPPQAAPRAPTSSVAAIRCPPLRGSQVAGDPSQTDRAMIAIYPRQPVCLRRQHQPTASGRRAAPAGRCRGRGRGSGRSRPAKFAARSAAWNGARRRRRLQLRPTPRLRLIVPSASPCSRHRHRGSQALRDRVSQLETELAESRRLLELRNAELARLQAGNVAVPAPAAQPVPAPAAEAPVEAAPATDAPGRRRARARAAARAPRRRAGCGGGAARGATRAGSFRPAAQVLVHPCRLARAGAAVSWAFVRCVGAAPHRVSTRRLGTMVADSLPLGREPSSDTFPLRKPPRVRGSDHRRRRGSGTQERLSFTGQDTRTVDLDDASPHASLPAADATAALEQGDPLAEADFHMAYGLYDQAADLVRIAIQREPERRDLKLKLLEVFFVWGNKDQFLQTAARTGRAPASLAEPGEWEKIVIMGKQLAPEDALFAQASSGAGSRRRRPEPRGRPEPRRFRPARRAHGARVTPDGGRGSRPGFCARGGLGDRDPTGNTALDFTLDDPARGDDPARTATTRQMVAARLRGRRRHAAL